MAGRRGDRAHVAQRVAEDIRIKVSELLRRHLGDPRLAGVHLTRVEVSSDLSHACIYFRGTPEETVVEDASAALTRASGFIRKRLGQALKLRHVPELHFALDELPDEGWRIEGLLATLHPAAPAEQSPDDADEDPDAEP